VPEKRPRKPADDERDVDYLICRQCNSPCYDFAMEKGVISDVLCEICGNEDPAFFNLGEEEEDE
jgi:hypothetical protein